MHKRCQKNTALIEFARFSDFNFKAKCTEELENASKNLHSLVFNPIQKELGGIKELFISSDGNLNLIPFKVLKEPDERFLIEDDKFNYLAVGREILGFGEKTKRSPFNSASCHAWFFPKRPAAI